MSQSRVQRQLGRDTAICSQRDRRVFIISAKAHDTGLQNYYSLTEEMNQDAHRNYRSIYLHPELKTYVFLPSVLLILITALWFTLYSTCSALRTEKSRLRGLGEIYKYTYFKHILKYLTKIPFIHI